MMLSNKLIPRKKKKILLIIIDNKMISNLTRNNQHQLEEIEEVVVEVEVEVAGVVEAKVEEASMIIKIKHSKRLVVLMDE